MSKLQTAMVNSSVSKTGCFFIKHFENSSAFRVAVRIGMKVTGSVSFLQSGIIIEKKSPFLGFAYLENELT